MARRPLSKRTRFEIFKRDGFRCVYCGATPNDSPLHVDHVNPVAEGGDTVETNLVTACQSCNGGKSAVPLDRKKFQPIDPDVAADHAEQIRAWVDAQADVLEAKREAEQQLVNFWCKAMGTESCDREVPTRLKKIFDEWGTEKATEAISIAAAKPRLYSDSARLRYLYGILRRWREEGEAVQPSCDHRGVHGGLMALRTNGEGDWRCFRCDWSYSISATPGEALPGVVAMGEWIFTLRSGLLNHGAVV